MLLGWVLRRISHGRAAKPPICTSHKPPGRPDCQTGWRTEWPDGLVSRFAGGWVPGTRVAGRPDSQAAGWAHGPRLHLLHLYRLSTLWVARRRKAKAHGKTLGRHTVCARLGTRIGTWMGTRMGTQSVRVPFEYHFFSNRGAETHLAHAHIYIYLFII